MYFRTNRNWYAYDVSDSFVLFVQSRYSRSKFKELIDEIGRTGDLRSSVHNVFRTTLTLFEKECVQAVIEESINHNCI